MNEDALLRALVEGTAGETGLPFFRALVQGLSEALGTHGAWITEYLPEQRRLRAIALRLGGQWVPHYEYDVEGTPCGFAIEQRELLFVKDRVADLFPGDNDLKPLGAVSYIGAGVFDESGSRVLGHLAVLHTEPMPDSERYTRIFRIFANRAGAELRRLNLERELRAKSEELDAVVESAMDAILILNQDHEIVRANAAAAAAFGTADLAGEMVDRFVSVQGAEKLEPLLQDLLARDGDDHRQLWIPGGVQARSAAGDKFAVEGTLSRFELNGNRFATLILRNISDRLAAEARLRRLTDQSNYLREELDHAFGEIIGESPPMRRLIGEIAEVARTDVSVLSVCFRSMRRPCAPAAGTSTSLRLSSPADSVNGTEDPRRP